MAPLIREMEARDIPIVAELMSQLMGRAISPGDVQNRLDWVRCSPIDWLYVYEAAGQVLGVLGFRLRDRVEFPGRFGEVSVIVTLAEKRRQGVGQAMMDFAEQLARDHGCEGMFLVCGLKRKDEAHHFYEDLGYQVTGYRFVKLFEQ
jgi:GNAT superfamily N-acetyltransferase